MTILRQGTPKALREILSEGAQIEMPTLGIPLHRLRYGHMAEHIQMLLKESGDDLIMCLLELGIAVIKVPQTPRELSELFAINPIIHALVMQIVECREQERKRQL